MNKSATEPSNLRNGDESESSKATQLARRAKAGDEEAFGELVRLYHGRVFALAYQIVNNEDDAREMAQQAWIKAWRRLGGFRGDAGFYTWMYRVTTRVCLDFLRKRGRRQELPLDDALEPTPDVGAEPAPSVSPRPDRQLERKEIRDAFEAALQTLSPEHRTTLVLREVEGLSYAEIAKTMRCRKGTVMSRLYYARRYLREQMGDVT
jgi:RNA polymerase sigma-70 factor (ECF subfamily)